MASHKGHVDTLPVNFVLVEVEMDKALCIDEGRSCLTGTVDELPRNEDAAALEAKYLPADTAVMPSPEGAKLGPALVAVHGHGIWHPELAAVHLPKQLPTG